MGSLAVLIGYALIFVWCLCFQFFFEHYRFRTLRCTVNICQCIYARWRYCFRTFHIICSSTVCDVLEFMIDLRIFQQDYVFLCWLWMIVWDFLSITFHTKYSITTLSMHVCQWFIINYWRQIQEYWQPENQFLQWVKPIWIYLNNFRKFRHFIQHILWYFGHLCKSITV